MAGGAIAVLAILDVFGSCFNLAWLAKLSLDNSSLVCAIQDALVWLHSLPKPGLEIACLVG